FDYGLIQAKQKLNPKEVVSMEDAYINQYGETLYKLFFQAYSEKVWGMKCSELSDDWVNQRTKGMSLVTAIKDAIVPSKGAVVSLIDEFMYPPDGCGSLSARTADSSPHSGHEGQLTRPVG